MAEDWRRAAPLTLVDSADTLPARLARLLASLPLASSECAFALDELSLRLGQRLPDQAQTLTYWQRGVLGRGLRRAGFSVRVELGRVVFMRVRGMAPSGG